MSCREWLSFRNSHGENLVHSGPRVEDLAKKKKKKKKKKWRKPWRKEKKIQVRALHHLNKFGRPQVNGAF